jgi:hypothetical protein
MGAVRTSETSVYLNPKRHYGRWWRQYEPLKRQSTSTILYGAVEDDGGSTAIWNIRPHQRDHKALLAMMEAVRTSETSVYFNNLIGRRGRWWRQYGHLKHPSTSARPQSAIGDDGGSTNLWNVGLLKQSYTAPWKMMEAVRPSETSVHVNETTKRYGRWWRQYEPLKRRST